MPLFTFKCEECEYIMEKFFHKIDEKTEVPCAECENEKCVRQFSESGTRVWLDAKTMLNEKILPDARRIMTDANRGKNDAFSDVCGD